MPLDPKLLEVLVCPITKEPLSYDREREDAPSHEHTVGIEP